MRLFTIILMLLSMPVMADLVSPPAHGFHWYSTENKEPQMKPVQKPKVSKPSLTPYEQLMEVRKATMNKLASALIAPSFDATYEYMKAQQVYAKNNQKFVQYWQQVLLSHPELDHSLNFPTDNTAVAIRNDSMNLLMERVVREGAKRYGLILFYKGNSSISQKFITHLVPFVNLTHFSMISVTTDGQPIEGLPNPKNIPLHEIQKTMNLQSRYMPALFLVDLKTQQMSPLSYGFVSTTELKERLLDVATHYKRYSYEGFEA
ncbi:type-F conjugative transfer system pilin assembly protein TraF [Legionella pneumophila]|uniref:type-F conjugative transfer system pilin assembly protein TraF n=1 Tax=Legionella pneumophila TaxID=446 RepID=UPI001A2BFD87|nr:type-F conjugative transfer system pilin assembly protein TraF [Legionella pneumophila]MDG5851963.1 type-F conjugative transfer system pilin assembly protein TraF [Legionella pneumophila]HAT1129932.1 type-F conjugative transfer system pilin assembly protein TraF [Legionella pneumophila]HAT7841513.1 type-F conjugative transfer system pilin assembly protein TraF [Legionella pneumophila]HAV1167412.1 type-F conjugative transfer system pilin assembly protein TraF [Legionella pneumophila]